jgi:phosphoglycolate phosphatase
MPTLVLFDIDGTLLLSAGAGRRAITRTLARLVPDTACFERVRFDGKTDPQIVAELLEAAGHPSAADREVVHRVCRDYVAVLEEELARPGCRVNAMPGILPLLDRLEADPAILIGLLTGNVARGAALKLSAAGLAPSRFRVGAYGSDSAHRPDLPAIAAERARAWFGRAPAGHEVVIIGDTPSDVTCGRSLGVRAIGVATGSYPVEELAAAGAFAVFPDLSDTDAVMRAILALSPRVRSA